MSSAKVELAEPVAPSGPEVDHDCLEDRWPPEVFSPAKYGDRHDAVLQRAIGAWSAIGNVKRFDRTRPKPSVEQLDVGCGTEKDQVFEGFVPEAASGEADL